MVGGEVFQMWPATLSRPEESVRRPRIGSRLQAIAAQTLPSGSPHCQRDSSLHLLTSWTREQRQLTPSSRHLRLISRSQRLLREKVLAIRVVLSIPPQSQGSISDGIAIDTSVRACVIVSDIFGFETATAGPHPLDSRSERPPRHIHEALCIYTSCFSRPGDHQVRLSTDRQLHPVLGCDLDQIVEQLTLEIRRRVIPLKAVALGRLVHVEPSLAIDLHERNDNLVSCTRKLPCQSRKVLSMKIAVSKRRDDNGVITPDSDSASVFFRHMTETLNGICRIHYARFKGSRIAIYCVVHNEWIT